jgi:protein-S-isoprenylcysteine O-methyltransferase Ste14
MREGSGRREPGLLLMAAIGGTLVAAVLVLFLVIAALVMSLVWRFTGVFELFNSPIPLRAVGAAVVFAGLGFLFWTVRVRRPRDLVVSSLATFRKLLRRDRIDSSEGRKEPFVPKGPYAYVRNPMYFGATAAIFGGGLFLGSMIFLLWSFFMFCWFCGYLIPFEERELAVLFGSRYTEYARQVPKMIPYGRKYRAKP